MQQDQPPRPSTKLQTSSQNLPVSQAVGEWQVLKEMAQTMMVTGFLPKSLTKPEQVIFIIMKGREIGMGPMQALSQIDIIQGVTCLKAEGMLSQVFKHCPQTKLEYIQNDEHACVIEVTRPGSAPNRFSFNMEDAQKANLAGKDNWKKFPRAMLRSRCVSEMCRALFPDAIQGCSYTPDEILDSQPEKQEMKQAQIPAAAAPQQVPNPAVKQPTLAQKFAELNISQKDLFEFVGKPIEQWSPADIETVKQVYQDLVAGKMDREDMLAFAKIEKEEK